MKKSIIYTLFLSVFITTKAQYQLPLNIPPVLSANFGELRPNHFHSGIDFKTAGVINKPVYSIAEGYISRISISPSGYGLAIYVSHPNGQTSVYAHLNKFPPRISQYIKNKQYEQERFAIDIQLSDSIFPLKSGDLIAYSGNSGSSGGPHVHFEIRDTNSQATIDPLPFYKDLITDSRPPLIKAIAIYPLNEMGAADFSRDPARRKISKSKDGSYQPVKDTIEVWGQVGIGVSAIDQMDGTSNIYGVKKTRLFCDGIEIFTSDISVIDLSKTRIMNSFVDFDYWSRKRIFYQKLFIEPGNTLDLYKSINKGFIDIRENRIYNILLETEDLHGNKSSYNFPIKGREQTIPQKQRCMQYMKWNADNNYQSDKFALTIPKGNLYDNVCFSLKIAQSAKHASQIYKVGNSYIPLHSYCDMTLSIDTDTLSNKSQYGVVRINGANESWIGGQYSEGKITARIRELGHSYAVGTDKIPPTITAVQPTKWVKNKKITIKLSDDKSGIQTYRGIIDDKFVLFENDVKSNLYTYSFDDSRLTRGTNHKLVFTATDRAGNTSNYEFNFKY